MLKITYHQLVYEDKTGMRKQTHIIRKGKVIFFTLSIKKKKKQVRYFIFSH